MYQFKQDVLTPRRTAAEATASASRWTGSPLRRCADFLLALVLLVLCAPLLALCALIIKLSSPGPVLFRQTRVGRLGRQFDILKLRTMAFQQREKVVMVTGADDRRITAVGRLLRRFKFDELPQLLNVLRGEMSFVGPRPLVPIQRPPHFSCRPGLTGAGSLAFRDQERSLEAAHAEQFTRIHDEALVPARFAADRAYMRRATLWSDLDVILQTALAVLHLLPRTTYDLDVDALIAGYIAAVSRQQRPVAAKLEPREAAFTAAELRARAARA